MKKKVLVPAGLDTRVELGDRVRDSLTGYEGIADSITIWRFGCRRIGVLRGELDKDGQLHERQVFDEPMLHVIVRANVPKVEQALRQARGGPKDARSERQMLSRA